MDKAEPAIELTTSAESQSEALDAKPKKPFIIPEVSVPVDVLEATTFFQIAASGGTN